MQLTPLGAICSRRSTAATLARHYLLTNNKRKTVKGANWQIKHRWLQKFLLTAGGAQRGRKGMKVKNFSARIGVA